MRHAVAWQLAQQSLHDQTPAVLITVAAVKGSAPREAGACMCVTAEQTAGTIGGGTLEYKAIASARELLFGDATWLHQQLGLGPALGQCCGGRVELLLERLDNDDLPWLAQSSSASADTQLRSTYQTGSRHKTLCAQAADGVHFEEMDKCQLLLTQPLHPGHFHLLLFGAGHLGQALAPLLATLPCTVHWIDSREDVLPNSSTECLQSEWLETPTMALHDAPVGSMALVMTHNHALDFDITAAALSNKNIAWVGMIGSRSKRRQFDRHLSKRAHATSTARLACPIGESNADLRDPAELAIALAAALLQARSQIRQFNAENQHHA